MIIVENSSPKTPINLQKPTLFISFGLLIILITAPAIIALSQNEQPTGTYLNPLPQNQLASATPTPEVKKSPEKLILTAQAYLEKAIDLSHKTPQTESDHQQIITFLNSGLEYANLAVTTAPNAPESYLVRARILASSTSIRPDATQLAQKDLETAQLLSGGQKVSFPTEIDLINYTPTQQASLDQNLVIAAPEESTTSTNSAQTESNITKLTGSIPSGKLSTTIKNSNITSDSYIYLIPTSSSQTPFVQTKSNGSATISITEISTEPTKFEYWIVNP